MGKARRCFMGARKQIGLSRCGRTHLVSCFLIIASSFAGLMGPSSPRIAVRLWCWSPSAHRIFCAYVRPGSPDDSSPLGNTWDAPCPEDPRHLLLPPKAFEPVGVHT